MKLPAEPAGKTPRAISDRTDTVSLGLACMCTASHDTPRKSEIASPPIHSSVRAAFFPCGGRNALTPFEIDSTPVSAAEPEANARKMTNTPTPPAAPAAIGLGTWAVGQVPSAHFAIPAAINTYIAATNA